MSNYPSKINLPRHLFALTSLNTFFNWVYYPYVGQKTKKHLTQRIQNLDDKMLEQNELSRTIKEDVCFFVPFLSR